MAGAQGVRVFHKSLAEIFGYAHPIVELPKSLLHEKKHNFLRNLGVCRNVDDTDVDDLLRCTGGKKKYAETFN